MRIAITDATDTAGADPDRASFSVAVQAAGVIEEEAIDLICTIGRHVLANLMPARRCRASPRAVKRPLSRYAYQSLCVDRHSYQATVSIEAHGPPTGEQIALELFSKAAPPPTGCGGPGLRAR